MLAVTRSPIGAWLPARFGSNPTWFLYPLIAGERDVERRWLFRMIWHHGACVAIAGEAILGSEISACLRAGMGMAKEVSGARHEHMEWRSLSGRASMWFEFWTAWHALWDERWLLRCSPCSAFWDWGAWSERLSDLCRVGLFKTGWSYQRRSTGGAGRTLVPRIEEALSSHGRNRTFSTRCASAVDSNTWHSLLVHSNDY